MNHSYMKKGIFCLSTYKQRAYEFNTNYMVINLCSPNCLIVIFQQYGI